MKDKNNSRGKYIAIVWTCGMGDKCTSPTPGEHRGDDGHEKAGLCIGLNASVRGVEVSERKSQHLRVLGIGKREEYPNSGATQVGEGERESGGEGESRNGGAHDDTHGSGERGDNGGLEPEQPSGALRDN